MDALSGRDQGADSDLGRRLDSDEARLAALERATAQMAATAQQAARLARIEAAEAALAAGQPLGDLPNAPPAVARFAAANPPTEASLRLAFPPAERAALAASQSGHGGKPFLARVLARAEDLVTVRQGDRVLFGDPAAGVLARARTALDAGDLAGAVAAVSSLSGPPAAAMAAWLADAKALLPGARRAGRHGRARLMRRVLYVLVACVVVLAVAWVLAGLPGRVTAEFGATTIEMATPVAALGLLLAVRGALRCCFACSAGCCGCPGSPRAGTPSATAGAATWRSAAPCWLSPPATRPTPAGKPAAPAGGSATPRKPCCWPPRRAGWPAATTRPRTAFRRLADRPDAAFLGYRGLMRQALTRQDWTEAAALARQAEAAHPGAEWLRHQRARLAIRAGHWTEALDLADNDARARRPGRRGRRAEQDPARATKLAREAWKADASLAPAALAYATRLRAEGREAARPGGDPAHLGAGAASRPGGLRACPGRRPAGPRPGGPAPGRGQPGTSGKPAAACAHRAGCRPDRRGAPSGHARPRQPG